MSLILSGTKSDIYGQTNKIVTSYSGTNTAVNASDGFTVATGSDGSKIVACSFTSGGLYTSSNRGSTYTLRQTFFTVSVFIVVCSSDATKVYVPVNGDFIYYSSDSGVTFTASNVSTSWVYAACSSDGSIVFGVAQGSQVYKSTNSGVTYSAVSIGSTGATSLCCSSDGSKVYTGTNGGIYYSSNTGTSYSLLSSIVSTGVASLSCSSDGTIVVVVEDSTNILYVSVDSGTTFNQRLTSASVPYVSPSGRIMMASVSTAVYISDNYGITWVNSGTTVTSVPIAGVGPLNYFISNSETQLTYGNGTGGVRVVSLVLEPINKLGKITQTVTSGTRANFNTVTVPATTISAVSTATTTNAASLYVQGPPAAGTNHTITNAYSFEVGYGSSIFYGPVIFSSPSTSSITASGLGSINFSGCSGSFFTSTGTVTLGGGASSVVLGSGTTPTTSLTFASGSTGTIDLTNSSGSFKYTSGPVYRTVRTLTGTTSLSASTGSQFIVVTSGTFTITLPGIQTSATNGIEYFITNSGSGTVTLSVANTGSEKFNGAATTSFSLSQHDRTHVIAYTNTSASLYTWYNF